MRTMRRPFLLIVPLALCGCLAAQLKGPVEDHRIQAQVIAESCAADGYGSGKCTQADLDAMADQAKLLDDIVKGKDPDAGDQDDG